MPGEPVDYVIGIQVGNPDQLTDAELDLISGGVMVAVPCPSPAVVLCPPRYNCCGPGGKCSPC
jgi:hypothetical protein